MDSDWLEMYLSADGGEWHTKLDFAEQCPDADYGPALFAPYGALPCTAPDGVAWICRDTWDEYPAMWVPALGSTAWVDTSFAVIRGDGTIGLSVDGTDWTFDPDLDLDETYLRDVVAWNGRLVFACEEDGHAAIWIWAP